MLLGELAGVFLEADRNSLSQNTLRAYRYDLNSLAQVLPELEASEVRVEHLRTFLGATANLGPSTLYETGMKVGEALGVYVGRVHPNVVDGGYIRVVCKCDEERIVP